MVIELSSFDKEQQEGASAPEVSQEGDKGQQEDAPAQRDTDGESIKPDTLEIKALKHELVSVTMRLIKILNILFYTGLRGLIFYGVVYVSENYTNNDDYYYYNQDIDQTLKIVYITGEIGAINAYACDESRTRSYYRKRHTPSPTAAIIIIPHPNPFRDERSESQSSLS